MNINRSPTCPDCRAVSHIGDGQRIFVHFADEETLASTSTRATTATNINNENEETIRSLIHQIEENSWKEEEYSHHMADFDANNEELSKLKSQLDDSSDDYKAMLEALDQLQIEKSHLKETIDNVERDKILLRHNLDEWMEKNAEHEDRIKSIEDQNKLLLKKLENTEKLSNGFQWEAVQKENRVQELEKRCIDNEMELKILKETVQSLQDERVKNSEEATTLNITRKLLQTLKRSVYLPNEKNDSNKLAVVPYTGKMDEWEWMMVPILKKSH